MVRAHVAEACGNPALCCDSVAASREDLGHAGSLQSGVGGAHRCAETCSAGTDHDDIVSVVDDLVGAQAAPPEPLANAMLASANNATAAPPTARNNSKMFSAKRLPSSCT